MLPTARCCYRRCYLLLQDEEELEWLAVAKEGKGVSKSERRQESAETEYHRLLCEESIQQARAKSFCCSLFLLLFLFFLFYFHVYC